MNLDLPDFSSFEKTIDALFSRVRGHIEPGSHRMQLLVSKETLEQLGRIPTVLVAGTNGKGTTCALLEQCFRDAGYKTALYTSPHLVSPTERIRMCGVPITRESFLESARLVYESAKVRLPDATFFELMTALAFEVIATAKIEVFVCEVGLGGRLDSTNILSPQVSVLTSVGLDHTEWLGPTEKSIAFEKSFVSRRNRALVVGSISEAARDGLSEALAITGGKAVFVDSSSDTTSTAETLVRAVLEQLDKVSGPKVTESAFKHACQNYFWPGRMDVRTVAGVQVMLDAAHNAHGVKYLVQQLGNKPQLQKLPRPRILVYATLADKDWRDVLNLLAPHFDAIHLTQTQSPRAVQVNDLIQYISSTTLAGQAKAHVSSSEALAEGLKAAQLSSGSLFILGSITLLGEAMEFFSLPVFPKQGSASP